MVAAKSASSVYWLTGTSDDWDDTMKLTVFAAGSRGDVQPCLALSLALQAEGYQVRLAAPADFAGFIQAHGVPCAPLRGDVQQVMASETGRHFVQTGRANPLHSIRVMRTLLAPMVREMVQDLYDACRDADALICLAVFGAFGCSIAQALDRPLILLEPTPLLPTRALPAAGWPIQADLGGLHNRLAGVAMLNVIWQWYRPFVNDFRKRLGLPAYSAVRFIRDLKTTLLLGAYSPHVIPPPPDWPATAHVAGYFWLDKPDAWQPPAALQAFLDAGPRPVYVGFGSMAGQDPGKMGALVLDALHQCGQRGVLATGWGGLHTGRLPPDVFVVDAASHGWLFPRMSAVVHHGGAGTTAAALRAGVPSVIVPFIVDQPFWGARVKALGVGPDPIPVKQLAAGRLAAAIQRVVTDAGMRQRAREIGAALRAEDGLGCAVSLIRQHLGPP
jgi:UDP:flavonoid glycosyltransferase YjiC (YdhE family)